MHCANCGFGWAASPAGQYDPNKPCPGCDQIGSPCAFEDKHQGWHQLAQTREIPTWMRRVFEIGGSKMGVETFIARLPTESEPSHYCIKIRLPDREPQLLAVGLAAELVTCIVNAMVAGEIALVSPGHNFPDLLTGEQIEQGKSELALRMLDAAMCVGTLQPGGRYHAGSGVPS